LLSVFGIRQTSTYTKEQKDVLLCHYSNNKYPTEAEIEKLSQNLDMTVQQVKKWFANKRTREKTSSF